jgi:hypothetical protein
MSRDDYFSSTELKERGWSDALIRDFAAEPCKLVKNPNYRSGPPMRLWSVERIEEIEERPEWQERAAKLLARRPAAQARALAAAEKRRQQTIEFAQSWTPAIRLPADNYSALVEAACEAYNGLHAARGNYEKFARPGGDPEFIDRIVGNFIRHECSDYEWMLGQIRGRVGTADAYHEIRRIADRKVNEAIFSTIARMRGAK